MSQELNHHERRRTDDAIVGRTVQQMLAERPLGLLTPSERVRLFYEAIAPLQAALVRLHTNEGQLRPRVVAIRNGDSFELPEDIHALQGEAADIERVLMAQIDAARAQILGGLEP